LRTRNRAAIIPSACASPNSACLCPKTGQPDFATLLLEYVPDRRCVELKSLKLYIWSFRDEGHFHEDVTNRILDDLVRATKPAVHATSPASFRRARVGSTNDRRRGVNRQEELESRAGRSPCLD
jgi:7-cyano-7-deazaguanine reductase